MPAFKSMRRLLSKSSSKEPTATIRPASSGDTSTSSGRSVEGSTVLSSEPMPGPGQTTPESSVPSSASVSSLPQALRGLSDSHVVQSGQSVRPRSMMANLNRRSVTGLSGMTTSAHGVSRAPIPRYAPRLTNYDDGANVAQKTALLQGTCGESSQAGHLLDGVLRISYSHRLLRQECQVVGGVFKFLAYLVPGRNKITLEFFSKKLKDNLGSISNQLNTVTLFFTPDPTVPPLRLAFLAAKDSEFVIDSTAERAQVEGYGLEAATAKFRMAAQICQSACAEFMNRCSKGGRSFKLEEEWTLGTTIGGDVGSMRMSCEPKIHVVQVEQTVAELRAITKSRDRAEVVRIALDGLEKTVSSSPFQQETVMMLLLDAHWDPETGAAEGHIDATGENNRFKVSILGSQLLYGVPSCIDDLDATLQDCTRLESTVAALGMKPAGSIWEVADSMLTAMFRSIMRAMGSHEKVSGINSAEKDGKNRLARLFSAREPFAISSRTSAVECVTRDLEPHLNPLDAVQLRFHPCFALPSDEPAMPASRPFVWPLPKKEVTVTAPSGITYIELFARNDPIPCGFLDYSALHTKALPNCLELSNRLRKELTLNETSLRRSMSEKQWSEDLRVVVHGYASQPTTVPDLSSLYKKNAHIVKQGKLTAYRSIAVGNVDCKGASFEEVVWRSAVELSVVVRNIKVYHDGSRIFGIEICHVDTDTQLFGTKGPRGQQPVKPGVVELDTPSAEMATGFLIWTDEQSSIRGVQVLSSTGVTHPRFGKTSGMSPYRALVPQGYTLAGLSGLVSDGLESMSLLIKQ